LSPAPTPAVRRLCVCVALALALLIPSAAQAVVVPLATGFETGDFSQVSQSSVLDGTLNPTTASSYDGSHAIGATYSGDAGNGYARAIENVAWSPSEDVWYGGAYYLPTGYLASLKGGNDIMRWDNWATYGSAADYGAIENWSDGSTRLILGKYTNDPGLVLGGPFHLPEGRWFWLEVHQRFSTVDGQALSDVYLDGRLISHSTAANNFGRGADRVRWGIVCIDAGRQTTPLSLAFDRLTISTSEVGPLTATPAPSSGASAPPPSPAPKSSGSTVHHRRHRAHHARVASKKRKAVKAHVAHKP
jgi:hypothetical protein